MKPLIFDDLTFEGSKFCQESESLQLSLMVMLASRVLDNILEQDQTRVFALEFSHIIVAPNG